MAPICSSTLENAVNNATVRMLRASWAGWHVPSMEEVLTTARPKNVSLAVL